WLDDELRIVFQLPDRQEWLPDAIRSAARFANRKYRQLIDGYRLDLGVRRPEQGLPAPLQELVSELVGLSVTGWARVLERIAGESERERCELLPRQTLALPALIATIRVPDRVWMRRLTYGREQRAVQALVEEFRSTGDVRKHLSAEVDIVGRVLRIRDEEQRRKDSRSKRADAVIAVRPGNQSAASGHLTVFDAEDTGAADDQTRPMTDPSRPSTANTSRLAEAMVLPLRLDPEVQPSLAMDDPLVQAPSIGPKTAARFAKVDIRVVKEFLAADCDELASQLSVSWITSSTLRLWQSQARLMCSLSRLLARHCQLLSGAGYQSASQLADDTAEQIHVRVSRYADTSPGRRYLRGAEPPTLDDVAGWHLEAVRIYGSGDRMAA
ncbi:MAG: DUF4332 domain-containing protein, partial [Planctomycetota bacterium]